MYQFMKGLGLGAIFHQSLLIELLHSEGTNIEEDLIQIIQDMKDSSQLKTIFNYNDNLIRSAFKNKYYDVLEVLTDSVSELFKFEQFNWYIENEPVFEERQKMRQIIVHH